MPDINDYNPVQLGPMAPMTPPPPVPMGAMTNPIRQGWSAPPPMIPGFLNAMGPMISGFYPPAFHMLQSLAFSRGYYIPANRRDFFESVLGPQLMAQQQMFNTAARMSSTEMLTNRLAGYFGAMGIPNAYAAKFAKYGMSLQGIPFIGRMMAPVMRSLMPQGMASEAIPGIQAAMSLQYPFAERFFRATPALAREQTKFGKMALTFLEKPGVTQEAEMKRLGLTFSDIGSMTQQMAARGMLPRDIHRAKTALRNMADVISSLRDLFGPNAPIAQIFQNLQGLTGGQLAHVGINNIRTLATNMKMRGLMAGLPSQTVGALYNEGARMGMQYGIGAMGGLAATNIGLGLSTIYQGLGTPGTVGFKTFEEITNETTKMGMQIAHSRAGAATALLEMGLKQGWVNPNNPIVRRYQTGKLPYVTLTQLTQRQGKFGPVLAPGVVEYYMGPGRRSLDQYMLTDRWQKRMEAAAHATLQEENIRQVEGMFYGEMAQGDIRAAIGVGQNYNVALAPLPGNITNRSEMSFEQKKKLFLQRLNRYSARVKGGMHSYAQAYGHFFTNITNAKDMADAINNFSIRKSDKEIYIRLNREWNKVVHQNQTYMQRMDNKYLADFDENFEKSGAKTTKSKFQWLLDHKNTSNVAKYIKDHGLTTRSINAILGNDTTMTLADKIKARRNYATVDLIRRQITEFNKQHHTNFKTSALDHITDPQEALEALKKSDKKDADKYNHELSTIVNNSKIAMAQMKDGSFMGRADWEEQQRKEDIVKMIGSANKGARVPDVLRDILMSGKPISAALGAMRIGGVRLSKIHEDIMNAIQGKKGAMGKLRKELPNLLDTSKWKATEFGFGAGHKTENEYINDILTTSYAGTYTTDTINRLKKQWMYMEAKGMTGSYEYQQYKQFTKDYASAKNPKERQRIWEKFRGNMDFRQRVRNNLEVTLYDTMKGYKGVFEREDIQKYLEDKGFTKREARTIADKEMEWAAGKKGTTAQRNAILNALTAQGAETVESWQKKLERTGQFGATGMAAQMQDFIAMLKQMLGDLISGLTLKIDYHYLSSKGNIKVEMN